MVPQNSGEESFVVGSTAAPGGATSTIEPAQEVPVAAAQSKTPPWFYAVAGAAVAVIAVSVLILVFRGGGTNTALNSPTTPQNPAPTPAVPASQKSVQPVQARGEERPSIDTPKADSKQVAEKEKKELPVEQPKDPELPAPKSKTEEPDQAFAGKSAAVNAPSPAEEKPVEKPVAVTPPEPEKKPAPVVGDDEDTEGRITKPKPVAPVADNADDSKPQKTNVAAKPEPAPAPAKPVAPTPPPPVCQQCMGTGFLPLSPMRTYIRTGSEAVNATTASNSVPWRLCPRCQGKVDPQTLVTAETARIAAASERQKQWEEMAGTKLTFAETHHVTLRSTMAESDLKIVANTLEQLTTLLQQNTQSTVLVQARPDTEQILIGADQAGYWSFLDALKALNPKEDWSLSKQSTGFMTPHLSVFNAQRQGGTGARSMALYQLGEMLIIRATDGKAPTWLRLGFASYCENIITKKNLVYAFAYEKNDVHFGENWDNEIKKFASQSKLKTWDLIFPCNAIGMSALDYLTCYSMVNFFMSSDPKLFPKLLLAFKDGLDSEKAIQKVYSTDYQRLQNMWVQWALSKQ
jgi:hypothetical protein